MAGRGPRRPLSTTASHSGWGRHAMAGEARRRRRGRAVSTGFPRRCSAFRGYPRGKVGLAKMLKAPARASWHGDAADASVVGVGLGMGRFEIFFFGGVSRRCSPRRRAGGGSYGRKRRSRGRAKPGIRVAPTGKRVWLIAMRSTPRRKPHTPSARDAPTSGHAHKEARLTPEAAEAGTLPLHAVRSPEMYMVPGSKKRSRITGEQSDRDEFG